MSSSVDNRIVKLGFDNSKFEAGVSQSMKTIDKLENALQFKGAEKGFENLQRDVDGVDFSPMMKGIEALEKRFSVMGIATMNVVNKITDSMINGAKKLEAATIGQIKSGGWSRAMNLANAKFQIEGLKEDWTEMEKAISYGVKDTAYGLDAAATAASSLVASGVAYRESIEGANDSLMHTALRGISGVAAMTNSSYEDISRIFTTVAGNGRLMGDQLLQLSSRGMNAAATLATALGKTEAEIRDMVSHGQIDFKTFATAMDDAFGAHAKDANKTFTGSLSNMKAALSRFGAVFATPIIGKTNTLFISITKQIDVLKKKLDTITVPRGIDELQKKAEQFGVPAAGYSEMVKTLGDKTIKLGEDFANMWDAGINAFSKLITSIDLSWFDKIVEKVDNVVVRIKEIFEALDEYLDDSSEEVSEGVNDAAKSLKVSAEEVVAAKQIIEKGMYGFGTARHKALVELFGGDAEAEQHAKNVQTYINSVVAAGYDYDKAAIKMEESSEAVIQSVEDVEKAERKANLKQTFGNIKNTLSNLFTVAKNLGKSAGKILNSAFGSFKKVFNIKTGSFSTGVESVSEALAKFSEKLIISDETASRIGKVFEFFFSVIKKGGSVLINAGKQAGNFVTEFKKSDAFGWISEKFDGFVTIVKNSDIFNWITDKVKGLLDTSNDFNFFGTIKDFFLEMADAIYNNTVFETIKTRISGLHDSIGEFELPEWVKNNSLVNAISTFFTEVGKIIKGESDLPGKLKLFFKAVIDSLKQVSWDELVVKAGTVLTFLVIYRIVQIIASINAFIAAATSVPAKLAAMFGSLAALFNNLGLATYNASKVLIYKAIAAAVLEIGIVIAALAAMPEQDLYRGLSAVITIAGIVMLLSKHLGKISTEGPKLSAKIKSLATLSFRVSSLGLILIGIAGVVAGIAVLMKTIDGLKDPSGTFKTVQNIILLCVVFLIGIFGLLVAAARIIKEIEAKLAELIPIALSVSVLMITFTTSIIGIATAILIVSMIPEDKLGDAIATIIGVMFVLTACIAAISSTIGAVGTGVGQMLAASVLLVALSAALYVIIGAIVLMAGLFAGEALVADGKYIAEAIFAIILIVATVTGAISIMAAVVDSTNSISGVAGAILAVTAMIAVIGIAIYKLSENLNYATVDLALAMAKIIWNLGMAITAILFAFTVYSHNAAGDPSEILLNIGIAFIAVGASMLLFAAAIKIITEATENSSRAFVALGVFAAVIIGLAVAATLFKGFGDAMMKIGEAFIFAGVGFTLVGVAAILVSTAFKIFASAMEQLIPQLDKFFTTIEDHSVAAVAVGLFTVVIVALIVKGIVSLANIITPIVQLITTSITTILSALTNFKNKTSNGASQFGTQMSAKTKAIVIGIIAGLIGAIITMTPEMLNALGQMIIKILAYLGSIAGDIAEGLVEFLINLINGVADAIRLNSARIANALWNVVYSLFSLLINVIREVVPENSMFGGFIDGFLSDMDMGLNEMAATRRKEAEELDKQKKLNNDFVLGIDSAAKSSSKSVLGSLGDAAKGFFNFGSASEDAADRVTGAFSDMSDTSDSSINQMISNNEELSASFSNLPAAGQEAYRDAARVNPSILSEQGRAAGTAYADGASDALSTSDMFAAIKSGDMSMEDFMKQTGYNDGSAYSDVAADAIYQPSEYEDSMTNNIQDGTVKAIEDSEEDVVKAVDKHITTPATDTVRNADYDMYQDGKHMLYGLFDAIDTEEPLLVARMVKFAKNMSGAFKEPMEINSPSKLFFRYGEYITEGLANGISETTKQASISMDELADTVLISFGAPMDYLGKIASGELIYDTSIRPVVDTSRISGSARSINGMFNTQTIQLSGFSGQLAADMTQLDNSNAAVVSELKQLREDMAAMTEEISNMQMVMDTGALVGQISGPIDRSLGRTMTRKGRGN